MLPYFILGLALLAGIILASRWYISADPKTLVKVLKWLSLGTILIIGLFLAVTGRLGWAIATLPALFVWFMRFRTAAQVFKNFSRMTQGTNQNASSEVETRFLRMSLNHESGDMDGEILEGAFRGRRIGSLNEAELLELLRVCLAEDDESAQILEAYLDRIHPDWRNHAENENGYGFFKDEMDRDEALEILGLQKDASAEEIKEAHHRLIQGLHPDHGGSTYLAAKINRAKDVLLS